MAGDARHRGRMGAHEAGRGPLWVGSNRSFTKLDPRSDPKHDDSPLLQSWPGGTLGDRKMDDDLYWRRFRTYVRRRAASQATLIMWPLAIVFFLVWVFVPSVIYAPGDVRGDLPWRLLAGGFGFGCFTVLAAYGTQWLLADRHGEKRPRREDSQPADPPS